MQVLTHTSDGIGNDAQLIARSLEQPSEFGLIFERHHRAVFRYVRSRLGAAADDIVGDTFAEAFRRRAKFRAEGSALPWLLGIATNMVARRRELERRWLRGEVSVRVEDDGGDALDERLSVQALAPALAQALARLRRSDRDVLLLHVVAELRLDEISIALKLPLGTVKSRLHRARTEMAAQLEEVAR